MSEDVTVPDDSTPAWSTDDPPTEQGPNETVEGAESVAERSEPDTEGEGPANRGTRAERRANRDKATRDDRVRTERDDLKAERDTLSGRVEAMQQAELLRHAGQHLADPNDLLLATSAEERAQCWNSDGSLDEGAMAALVDSVLDQHPHWKRTRPASGAFDMGYRRTAPADTPTARWHDILRR